MTDSQHLLAEYRQSGSDAAFRELVTRYVALVYSTALRLVAGDTHRAEDVTQTVFLDLARKARTLPEGVQLGGWLHRDTCLVAGHALRGERRRQARERQAVEMNALQNHSEADFSQVAPLLDDAINELGEADRTAILLRFFEQQDFRAVGQALGSNEDAARMRVTRALEKLEEFLRRRGITTSAASLGLVLTANAVQAAPVGLAITIATAAALAGATTAATTTASFLQIMTTTKIKLVATIVIAAFALPLAVLWRQNVSLRSELALLRASAPEAQRSPERNLPSGKPAITNDELRRLRIEHLELLRLRGRVTQLANELRQRKAPGTLPDTSPNPASEPEVADSILFSASLTNRVIAGQTLVLGGWSKDGMRGYLLLTPAIAQSGDSPDADQITVQSQMVGAPESFWTQIGWADAKSDIRRSALAGVLTRDQLVSLLQVLNETKGAEISNTSPATGRDGERMGFGFSTADDNQSGALMAIDLYPRIAADGQSVDFEIRPSALSTNTPIHPSLKPSGQPAAPSEP